MTKALGIDIIKIILIFVKIAEKEKQMCEYYVADERQRNYRQEGTVVMRVKKWTAILLAALLVLGQLPHTSFAAELIDEAPDASVSVETPYEPETALEEEAEAEAEASGEEQEVSAPETVVSEPAEQGRHTITGFPEDGPLRELTLNHSSRPPLSEVLSQMPTSIPVFLDGGSRATELPVSWFCAGDDYESSEAFYFQFSPKWDESRYKLAEGLEVVADAPYVAVSMRDVDLSPLSVETVEAEAFQYLVGPMGLNTAAACGVLANIYHESAFKPNNLQDSFEKKLGYTDETYTVAVDKSKYKNFVKDSAGYGLCQWTYWSLKQGLLNYVKNKKASIGNSKAQMEFLKQDLGTSRTKHLKAVANTKDGAYSAGKYFCQEYERPGRKDQPVVRAKRARDYYWPKYHGALVADSGSTAKLDKPVLVGAKNVVNGVTVTWKAVSGAAKYRVYRRVGAGKWSELADVSGTTYTDKTPRSGTAYDYTVGCLNAAGTLVSSYDSDGVGVVYYAAPEIKSVRNGKNGILVQWASMDGIDCYLIYRRESDGAWKKLSAVEQTRYTDTDAQVGKSYHYAVRSAGEDEKPLSWYHTSSLLKRLTIPEGQTAVNVSGGVKVSWKAVTGAGSYNVYRRAGSGAWKRLKTVKTTAYTDKAVKKKNGSTYAYTIRAVSGDSISDYDRDGAVICRLSAPAITSAKNSAAKKIAVRWKKNAKAQGYQVRYIAGSVKTTENVSGAGKVSHTLSGVSKGKTYKVYVRAWRKVGKTVCYSAWSGGKSVKVSK